MEMAPSQSQQAMDAAKQAVAEFLSRNGHHDTTVRERVMPAVTHLTVTKTEAEEVELAVDREQHIAHYHTTLQPVFDEQTLEVQHRANVLPVETKVFEHDDRKEVQRRLEAEAAKFRDETVHEDGEHTVTHLQPVEGAHYHHHVHEVIRPLLNKHIIEPWVVHTAHQVHEIHHLAARHHTTTMLPAVSLAEFKRQGGILTGREERYDFFQGEPKSSGGVLGDSDSNPLPKELRTIGHEDRVAHDQAQEASAAPGSPTLSRTPTAQGNLARAPTGQGNLARAPTGQSNLSRINTGPVPAPQEPHPHTDPTAPADAPAVQPLHPHAPQFGQFQPGTPSTGHFGLMPLQLAKSAGDAVRTGHMLRTSSRTPQPTTALSVPQSSAAQQVGAQTQRQGPAAGASQQGGQGQQSQAQQAGNKGQQPGSSGR